MQYKIIDDSTTRNRALLAGDVHFIDGIMSSYYFHFKVDPYITFLNTSTTSKYFYYLVMNNNRINRTFREAISYAIDYDYILNNLQDDVERLKSPVPAGMLYANETFDVPTLNITRARLSMLSMGFGDIGWTDAQWREATFFSVNYSYCHGVFREDLAWILHDNLDLIGIEVLDQWMGWSEFIYRAYGYYGQAGYDDLGLFWIGSGADFNDPGHLVNLLFSNESEYNNAAQYNGYTAAIEARRNPLNLNDNVQLLMEVALSETDPTVREALYDRIQELLVEEDFPWAFGYSPYVYNAFNNHVSGFQQNSMSKIYFYPCNFIYPILPGSVTIYPNIDNPDTDGSFDISWSSSTYTDNYSLYRSSNVITTIDGSVTLLLDEITGFSYKASGYSDGTYYFVVVSKNGNGNTISNNMMVTVELEPSSLSGIRGFEMWIILFTIVSTILVTLLRMKKKYN
jgi:ABC-type transport system substrate-binding protein